MASVRVDNACFHGSEPVFTRALSSRTPDIRCVNRISVGTAPTLPCRLITREHRRTITRQRPHWSHVDIPAVPRQYYGRVRETHVSNPNLDLLQLTLDSMVPQR